MEKIIVFLIGVFAIVVADFACICNYNVEESVFDSTSDNANTIGYMYEFDCKEQVPTSPASDTWLAVAIEHQIGYVKNGSGLQLSLCAGSPPEEDKVTTSATTPHTTQLFTKSTSVMSTTTQHSSPTTSPTPTTAPTVASTTSTQTMTSPVTTPKTATSTNITTITPTTTAELSSSTSQSSITTTRASTTTKSTTAATSTTQSPSSTTAAPSTSQASNSSTTAATSTTQYTTSSTTPAPATQSTSSTTAATSTTHSPSSTTAAPSTSQASNSSTTAAASTTQYTTSSTSSAQATQSTSSITAATSTTQSPSSTTAAPSTSQASNSSTTAATSTTQYTTSSTTPAPATQSTSSTTAATSTTHSPYSTTAAPSTSQALNSSTTAAASTTQYTTSSTTPAPATSQALNSSTTTAASKTPSTSSTNTATSTTTSTFSSTTASTSTTPSKISSTTASTIITPTTLSTTPSATRTSPTETTTNTSTGTSTFKTTLPSSTPASASVSVSTTRLPLTSISGATSLCQAVHIQHASLHSNNLARFGDYCYELMPYQKVTWQHGEALCQSGGGHLVDIRNSGEQAFIQRFVQRHIPNHAVWIGLHDRKTENHFQWTSGSPVFYTHWMSGHTDNVMNHTVEDCVVLVPYKNGAWDDIPCGVTGILGSDIGETHPIVCKFDAHAKYQITTLPSVTRPDGSSILGNVNLCPRQFQQHAVAYGNTLAQYGSHCYELMPRVKVTWIHGEEICRSSGGHLVYIGSEATQNFVESILKRYMPTHATWIGLHDLNKESQFEWTTGNQVSYTNWLPGHTGNFMSHTSEDCVVLIPYKGGHWDDIPCGDTGIFIGGDIGETHSIICQYDITAGPAGPSMVG